MSTVFLAEAESGTRRRIEKVLIDDDLHVEVVSNGRALLDRVKSSPPDLVILDVALPGTSGKELIDKVRVHAPNAPVLIMAHPDADHVAADALERGAADYISKPIKPNELLVRVRRALGQSRRLHVAGSEVHNPQTGRIDARLVAKSLGIPLRQLAATLNANYATVHKTPDAPALQNALRPIKEVIALLSRFTRSAEDIRKWLNNPHPDLGKKTPLEVILKGRASAVATILENAMAGISS